MLKMAHGIARVFKSGILMLGNFWHPITSHAGAHLQDCCHFHRVYLQQTEAPTI